MLKLKLSVFMLAAVLCYGAVPAKAGTAADPCDPAVMTEMSTAAGKAYNRASDVLVTFLKPPPPAASSSCLRSLMNVWSLDPSMALPIFPTGTLGYTIGGFTLTGSSPAAIVMGLVNSWFQSNFGNLVCGELWSGIGQAMRPLSFNPDGSINIGASLSGSISGIQGLSQIINIANGGTASINFPGGFTGSITVAP